MKKKLVSAYVQGGRSSTDYYRIYQYLDNIEQVDCIYHQMVSDDFYRKFMPMSKQPLWFKLCAYIFIYFRTMFAMIWDVIHKPDFIVVHKRIMPKQMTPLMRFILLSYNKIGKGKCKIIYDFDDYLLGSSSISDRDFLQLCKVAYKINVTHDYLAENCPNECRNKVSTMPTTDGDMFRLYTKKLQEERLKSLRENIKLVWVATAGNLPYLVNIVDYLEDAAKLLKDNEGRGLILKVVSNGSLECQTKNLKIENIKWTRAAAIRQMMESHIGLMPLEESHFTKGKGGFKLIQYLSIGLPGIGSAVGFNKEVLSQECGILINNEEPSDWSEAIFRIANIENYQHYSEAAYQQWNNKFHYKNNLERWKSCLEINK